MEPEVLAALEALRNAVARTRGRRLLFVNFLYEDGRSDLLSVPPPTDESRPPQEPARSVPTGRRATVLDVLARAERVLKGSAIARRAGLSYTSHFRELLGRMADDGEIQRVKGRGYWRVDSEPPDEDD